MYKSLIFIVFIFISLLVAQEKPVALIGGKVITITQGEYENGLVVFRSGKILYAGKMDESQIPSGAVKRDLSGKVIMPGLIDSHSHIGVFSKPYSSANMDVNEGSGPVQGQLRALDAFWPDDKGIKMALAGGITTANVMPGSGNIIGGQTIYIKLAGKKVEDMLIIKNGIYGGMKMANGENPKRNYGSRGKAPMTRMSIAAMQREVFIKAREYMKKWKEYRNASAKKRKKMKAPEKNLLLEAIGEVLQGKRIVHFHSHRADDIMTILRLKKEFGFKVVVHHVTEGAKVAEELAKSDVPASVIIVDSPGGKAEALNLSIKTPGLMQKAGVLVGLHSDDPIYESRLFLRAGGLMVKGGMAREEALKALTINNAKILDLDDRIGSLEKGKDADIIVLSGDPFATRTHVLQTYVNGELVFDWNRPEDKKYAVGGVFLEKPVVLEIEEERHE